MGIALQDQGKLEEAIRLTPEYVDAHYNMGNVLYEQGRLEEAIKAYSIKHKITKDTRRGHQGLQKALSIKPEFACL